MALRVWLPLNGDLKNYGLSGIQPTSSSLVYTNGKIGQCLVLDKQIDTTLPFADWDFVTNSCSFGCWVKVSAADLQTIANEKTFDSTYNTMGGTLLGNHSYGGIALRWKTNDLVSSKIITQVDLYGNIRNSDSYIQITNNYTIPFDTWTHVMLVINRGTQMMGLYINGELFNEQSISRITGSFRTGNFLICQSTWDSGNGITSSGKFSLNDVRVYSHALSVKEIKEISKGLFFHLPLADTFVASSTKSFDCSGYNYTVTNTGAFECNTDTKRNQYSTVFGGSSYMTTENMNIPDSLTISFWLKRTNYGNVLDWRNSSGSGVQPIYINSSGQIQYWSSAAANADYFNKVLNTNTWYHICLVANTSTVKLYVDGTLIGSKANAKTAISAPLKIGASYSNTNIINANISDLRIYATELSADDIAQLYKIPAFIDDHGNFYCHEFEAYTESDSFDIRNTGFARFFEFREEDNLEHSQIYEI